MAAYDNLRAVIAANVFQNNENRVTADMVKTAMNEMVNSLGAEFQFGGVAEPGDPGPGTPDYNVAYLAVTPGTYSNFGGTTIGAGQIGVFLWNGAWQYKVKTVIEIINNLYAGGANSVLSAEQGKQIWASISKLLSGVFSDNVVDIHSGEIASSAQRASGDFFLKAGVKYTLGALFDAQPEAGTQINVWIYKAGTTTGYLARVICYAASWNTKRTAQFVPPEDGMYYVMIRSVDTASSVGVHITLDNPFFLQTFGALSNYFVPAGALSFELIKGKVWADNEQQESNIYRASTPIFRIAQPKIKISCNYAGGYSYYVYRKEGGQFVALATNVTEDREFELENSVFYVAIRAGGNVVTDADLSACGLSILMERASFSFVPNVDDAVNASEAKTNARIESLSNIILSENTIEAEAVASSTAAVPITGDFFLKAGAQYTLSAEMLEQPTDDAQINVWVYKSGTTSGYLARIILYGGETWSGPRTKKFSVNEDGAYYIAYRVLVGGAQTIPLSVSVDNPFYNKESDGADDLPSYYFPYITDRATAAKKEMAKCGAKSVCLFMITDAHSPQNYGQSGNMLRYLSEQLQVRMLLFGGDLCPSLTTNWGGNAANAEDAIALSDNALTKILSNFNSKIFRVKGNHDYSVADYSYWVAGKSYKVGDKVVFSSAQTSGGDNYSYTCIEANSDNTFDAEKWERGEYGGAQLTQIQTQRLILPDAIDSGMCVFPENSKASYYYFDIPSAKMRVICWDCCDTDSGFAGISNVTQRISDEQFAWMISNAILTTPADYRILSYGHIPVFLNQSMSNGGYNYAAWNISRRQLIAAINGKTSVTIGGVNYDFTSFAPNVIMDLAGHTHADCITRVNGAFGVTIAADYWGNDTKNSPLYYHFGIGSLASRTGGTTREQAFDLIIIDTENGYIRFVRFGAGIDRYLKMEQETVQLGETLQISSELSGTKSYYVYDSDLRAQDADGKYRPTTTRASIDADGILTPISAGDVVVMVYDSDNNVVEVIGVTIQ